MPSSRANHIPMVLSIVRQLKPMSILDIGVGFGKWGHLFREYTDIVMSERDPSRYSREGWLIRIDGIEGYQPYVTPMHRYLYNEIFIGDMRQKIDDVGTYDIVFLGDVIEHIELDQGKELLRKCLRHAKKAVIVTTPAKDTHQPSLCENDLETHQCLWAEHDFRSCGPCVTRTVENDILVAVFSRETARLPICESHVTRANKRRQRFWQLVRAPLGPLRR